MEQKAGDLGQFEQTKKFIHEFFTAITEKSLPQLKLYLKGLQKQINDKDTQSATSTTPSTPISHYSSLSDLLNHTLDANSKTALHFACARGDPQIVRLLIQQFKSDTTLKDSEKYPPFFTAINHGNLQVVKYFIEELKQPVNGTVEGNISGLHMAAGNDYCEMVQYLVVQGADKEMVSVYGKPINWSVGSNRTEASLLLLEEGVDPNGDMAAPFPAPLILALDFGNKILWEKLIEKGADLNVKDAKGYSLLHLACEKGDLQTVKYLVSKGLDVHYKAENKSPLYLAFEHEKYEVVQYLKSQVNKDQYLALEEQVKSQKKKVQEGKLTKEQAQGLSKEFKQKGNKLYSEKKFEEAVQSYTKAIQVEPENNILYSNRAAAHLALKNYEKTVEDCKVARNINPNHIKTLVRQAQAYVGLNNYLQAAVDFWQALKLQPNNKQVLAEFNRCSAIAKQQHQSQK